MEDPGFTEQVHNLRLGAEGRPLYILRFYFFLFGPSTRCPNRSAKDKYSITRNYHHLHA